MESKSGSDPAANVLPSISGLTAEDARKLDRASLATWLAAVWVASMVIGVALSVSVWR